MSISDRERESFDKWLPSCVRFNEDGSGAVSEIEAYEDYVSWCRGWHHVIDSIDGFSIVLAAHVTAEPNGRRSIERLKGIERELTTFHGIELVQPAGCSNDYADCTRCVRKNRGKSHGRVGT
jgi:hypothetical protein